MYPIPYVRFLISTPEVTHIGVLWTLRDLVWYSLAHKIVLFCGAWPGNRQSLRPEAILPLSPADVCITGLLLRDLIPITILHNSRNSIPALLLDPLGMVAVSLQFRTYVGDFPKIIGPNVGPKSGLAVVVQCGGTLAKACFPGWR